MPIAYTRISRNAAAGGRSPKRAHGAVMASAASSPCCATMALVDPSLGTRRSRARLVGSVHARRRHGRGVADHGIVGRRAASGSAAHWVTATAAPCTGIFKPVRVTEPLDLGPAPSDHFDDSSVWWRHELLHRRALADPARLVARFASERDDVEARWLAEPPEPVDAFAEADRLLERWTEQVRDVEAGDSAAVLGAAVLARAEPAGGNPARCAGITAAS